MPTPREALHDNAPSITYWEQITTPITPPHRGTHGEPTPLEPGRDGDHAAGRRGAPRTRASRHAFPALPEPVRAKARDFRLLRAETREAFLRASTPALNQGPKVGAVRRADIDMSDARAVVSSAMKFVLPIPPLPDGEPLVYPPGELDAHGRSIAGLPMRDYHGNIIEGTGVVFRNEKDQSPQGVKGDGSGVIIFNLVTPGEAERLRERIAQAAPEPGMLTRDAVLDILAFAESELGLKDRYDSNTAYAQGLLPLAGHTQGLLGLFKRDDTKVCRAVSLPGEGTFEGPAAGPQRFERGAGVVHDGDEFRLVQAPEFALSYSDANSRELLDAAQLPVGLPAFKDRGYLGYTLPRTKPEKRIAAHPLPRNWRMQGNYPFPAAPGTGTGTGTGTDTDPTDE
jgi:hypothetical protein